MNEWVFPASLVAMGMAFPTVIAAALVIYVYGELMMRTSSKPLAVKWFSHGISAGFFIAAANTVFWSVKWIMGIFGYWEWAIAYTVFGGFMDILNKGGIIYAAFWHLRATVYQRTGDERGWFWPFWTVLRWALCDLVVRIKLGNGRKEDQN